MTRDPPPCRRPRPSIEIKNALTFLENEVDAGHVSVYVRDEVSQLLMAECKKEEDVCWLRDLIHTYDAGSASMQEAVRLARIGRDRLSELNLQDSIHEHFLDGLFNYVMDRKL